MAKPRVFISSTFYDLRHIRNDLDEFVSGLGFESVLSEKGDIAYEHDRPLDESCYREVNRPGNSGGSPAWERGWNHGKEANWI